MGPGTGAAVIRPWVLPEQLVNKPHKGSLWQAELRDEDELRVAGAAREELESVQVARQTSSRRLQAGENRVGRRSEQARG